VNKRIVTILAIILSSLSGFAQKIVGSVLNGDSARLGGCTITLTNISIKKIVKLTATNKQGEYVFENLQTDSFKIAVSYVGYSDFTTLPYYFTKK
jgi:Carboxypeptidase regulatory-like domain